MGNPETGFLAKYFVAADRCGKNPVSLVWMGGEKPGFWLNTWLQPTDAVKTRFLWLEWIGCDLVFRGCCPGGC